MKVACSALRNCNSWEVFEGKSGMDGHRHEGLLK